MMLSSLFCFFNSTFQVKCLQNLLFEQKFIAQLKSVSPKVDILQLQSEDIKIYTRSSANDMIPIRVNQRGTSPHYPLYQENQMQTNQIHLSSLSALFLPPLSQYTLQSGAKAAINLSKGKGIKSGTFKFTSKTKKQNSNVQIIYS